MAAQTPPAVLVRRLIAEVATLMQAAYTFRDIADMFYEVGVISAPESPYPDYPGNKRDYVLDKLHHAPSLEDFLRVTVPRVVFECDIDGPSPASAVWAMKRLGYALDEDGEKHGVASYDAPDALPQLSSASSGRSPVMAIDIPDLPADIQELIDELNDSLNRGNKNAAALLTRKIIQQSIFIAMNKRGQGGKLRTTSGDDVDLHIALDRCKQEYGLSAQVTSRITSAKWIGDSANHSYRVKVNEADLDRAITGLRLFLQEIL